MRVAGGAPLPLDLLKDVVERALAVNSEICSCALPPGALLMTHVVLLLGTISAREAVFPSPNLSILCILTPFEPYLDPLWTLFGPLTWQIP